MSEMTAHEGPTFSEPHRRPDARLSSEQAGILAEKIAKMLFTGSDGTEYAELLQVNDMLGGMHLSWAYVVENVRRILEAG